MRRTVLVILMFGATVFVPPAAHAGHKPNSYCSESGDVCLSTTMRNNERKLRIGLAAEYFSRYKLCVVTPDDSRDCIQRPIRDLGKTYGDSVNWIKHFPNGGDGAYKVIWRQGGNRLGKILGFHVKS